MYGNLMPHTKPQRDCLSASTKDPDPLSREPQLMADWTGITPCLWPMWSGYTGLMIPARMTTGRRHALDAVSAETAGTDT